MRRLALLLFGFLFLSWAALRYLCRPKEGSFPMYRADDDTWVVVDGYGLHTYSKSIDMQEWMDESRPYWWDE